MRKSIPWKDIVNGKILNQGTFGAEYMVPDLGRVWVGTSDLTEVAQRTESPLCNLVAMPAESPEEAVWAIVGFQSSSPKITD